MKAAEQLHRCPSDYRRRKLISRILEDSKGTPEKTISRLRLVILRGSLQHETLRHKSLKPQAVQTSVSATCCSLRGKVWKALLRIPEIDASEYFGLVAKGPSTLDGKIRQDTFRTFDSNQLFAQRVPEEQLIRLLNAFVHDIQERPLAAAPGLGYVQGMNVLCAPLLYVMPEVEAFFCFRRLVKCVCPFYVTQNIEGVMAGVELLDRVIAAADPVLAEHLRTHDVHAHTWGVPPVMTFGAASPPLAEVLILWDFLLAFGLHWGIVCTAARVVALRDRVLASSSPYALLRDLPPLDAALTLRIALSLFPKLGPELCRLVREHASSPAVVRQLLPAHLRGALGPPAV
eukprot:gnl/Chilomastix_cuspidata/3200.p1 GENE.gnl/Chilomastix_cuspidata/3200~~gnl/Chilomastix_cuspidata/3200.p1  ORF type:complete len:345 (-),score=160.20 gnl/Chilomastix_cuspidata/3200:962-1996(-)